MPGVDKLYGEEIRGCIIADKDCSFLGCDLTNIEDKTKRHYIFKYDPDYVNTMNIPGYDAHLEIAMLGGYLKQEDIDFYKETDKYLENCQINGETVLLSEEDKARYKSIKKIRQKAKVTNFSCTYKVGAPTLSRNMGAPEKEAKSFIDVFWKRNKAILQIEKDTVVRKINGDMWLQNPMNMFWYSLRNEKDIFSTLNQGSAVYCFDVFLGFVKKEKLKVPFQYHDEFLANVLKTSEQEAREKVVKAMQKTNDFLKLNVELGCSIQYGQKYSDCH